MDDKLWIRARQSIYDFGIDIVLMSESTNGRRTIIKDIVFEDVPDASLVPPKAITIDKVIARRLMDDLWLSGVRPSKELYGESDKEDIKNHLADMRSIVFNGITMNIGKDETKS